MSMSVAIWLTAATITNSSKHDRSYNRTATFFLLTMAGNLGAVLATDLVTFFSFSTLMGYGFYGLLIQGGDADIRRVGRLYLIILIVADLLLFEALLLAASTTENLRYEAVRQTMAEASYSQFYLWMVLVGFALKAGIWPIHLWLSAAFKSASSSTVLLLVGVPVAMGLLGMLRWLPAGEQIFYVSGMILQVLGVTAMLYAILKIFRLAPVRLLPGWITVAVTGLFIASLGMGLAHPTVWRQYDYLSHPVVASLGIFLAALTLFSSRIKDTQQHPGFTLQQREDLGLWAKQWIAVIQQWAKKKLHGLQHLWRVSWLKAVMQYQRILNWQKPSSFVDGWSTRITLFVLLGLALVWFAG